MNRVGGIRILPETGSIRFRQDLRKLGSWGLEFSIYPNTNRSTGFVVSGFSFFGFYLGF